MYHARFNLQALFLGGAVSLALSETRAFVFGYTFMDVNLEGKDYGQNHSLAPALRFSGEDSGGGSYTTTLGLDYVKKKFASSGQAGASDMLLKWDYSSLDKENQDSYRRSFQVGKSSEGIVESEFSFLGFDWDWSNRWDRGMLFDIGLGIQYRNYANDTPLSTDTPLGTTHVDVPGRFSFGLGYQFRPQVRALATYQYLLNLSNKSPYARSIVGIGINGAF